MKIAILILFLAFLILKFSLDFCKRPNLECSTNSDIEKHQLPNNGAENLLVESV